MKCADKETPSFKRITGDDEEDVDQPIVPHTGQHGLEVCPHKPDRMLYWELNKEDAQKNSAFEKMKAKLKSNRPRHLTSCRQSARWLRSWGGLSPFLLLEVAAEKNKTQRKEAKDKRVFLRLRDDGAVNSQGHRRGKVRIQTRPIGEIANIKIANRFVH